jgi:hypothetical protein
VPDDFDAVELWGVFWQPLDGEPVRASREGRERELTDVDRPNSPMPAIWRAFLRLRCSRTNVRCAPVLEKHAG